MNPTWIFRLAGLLMLLLCALSCDLHRVGKTYAEADVKRKVTPGMSKESLLDSFGRPTFEDVQGEDIILTYLSDDQHRSGYRFTGFTVLVRTNTVIKWAPIYAGMKADSRSNTAANSTPSSIAASDVVTYPLKFYVVKQGEFPGSIHVNNEVFPSLGYISARPQLQVTRLIAARWHDHNSRPMIEITLADDDALALRKLTEESVNEKLLIVSGDSMIEASQIWEPVVTKTFRLSSTNQARLQEFFRRLRSLVKADD